MMLITLNLVTECFITSRIKIMRAGELDCPQYYQALQAGTELPFKTGLSIVFSINEKAVIEYL